MNRASAERRSFRVAERGSRLDQIVAATVPTVTRTQAARWIAEGLVLVDGKVGRAATRPREGAVVEVTLPESKPSTLAAEPIPLPVIYRDEDIIVVDKPADLVVHPAPGHPAGTLANALLALDPDLRDGEGHRAGLVHRLDKGTSGLVVVARNDAALRELQRQWASRSVVKEYVALVHGHPREPEATVDVPIGRDPRDRKKMAVTAEGRSARTHYRVASLYGPNTLLRCRIETGRTHQIRVHLSSIGHPVVGDETYGGRDRASLGRHFLHATALSFAHPRTGVAVSFESPLPSDLKDYLESATP